MNNQWKNTQITLLLEVWDIQDVPIDINKVTELVNSIDNLFEDDEEEKDKWIESLIDARHYDGYKKTFEDFVDESIEDMIEWKRKY